MALGTRVDLDERGALASEVSTAITELLTALDEPLPRHALTPARSRPGTSNPLGGTGTPTAILGTAHKRTSRPTMSSYFLRRPYPPKCIRTALRC